MSKSMLSFALILQAGSGPTFHFFIVENRLKRRIKKSKLLGTYTSWQVNNCDSIRQMSTSKRRMVHICVIIFFWVLSHFRLLPRWSLAPSQSTRLSWAHVQLRHRKAGVTPLGTGTGRGSCGCCTHLPPRHWEPARTGSGQRSPWARAWVHPLQK